MTIQGTCYFRSTEDAYIYFAKEETDKESVDQYIKEELIHIGLPPNLSQFKFTLIEGRYHIEER